MPSATDVSPRTLHIIRAALFAGIAVFGVVIWRFLPRSSFGTVEPALASILTWTFYALCAFAIIGTVYLRAASNRAVGFAARASITIAAWALTEGVALFGGILWILTGRPTAFFVGAALFVISATAVPVPSTDGSSV
jgi:hypothetical protein